MIIARNTIAILLETKPSNIKSIKQVDDDIYIQLRDFSSELSMTVQEYQSCLYQLRKNKGHINRANFITVAAIMGMFVFVAISSINTNIASHDSSQTSIQLVTDYSNNLDP